MPTPELPLHADLWRETCSWEPTTPQQAAFVQLYAGILAGNRQLNLTRIVEPAEFWEKHLWDSLRGLAPLQLLNTSQQQDLNAIDIGTGAGFPGLPLAIVNPKLEIVLLDATRKKIAFLEELAAALGCDRVAAVAARAEEAGRDPIHREAYDFAFLRAVGPASVCAEYALPLLGVGGTAVLYRGQWSAADTDALLPALALLGGELAEIAAYTTPLGNGSRHCLYIKKVMPTPTRFPRLPGTPSKKPL
ncbi:MAG: 16S rRNA (guanine(527)-N(7))-methyltransferase RsmG [Cyanobacteria bacterium J06641_5]